MSISPEIMDTIVDVLDWAAVGVAFGVLAKIIPVVAGAFSIAWLGTQLYDRWIKKKE